MGRYLSLPWQSAWKSPLSFVLRLFIRLYGYTLSSYMGGHCRFMPTCSEYADEALLLHGAWAGGLLSARRILRCRPSACFGADNVPKALPQNYRWYKPWNVFSQES